MSAVVAAVAPRLAVLFRTHFWDAFAQRAAERMRGQSAGADFFVLANETAGPLDTRPFPKIAFTPADFAALGLPAVAGESDKDVMWWNCDYPLYKAVQVLPDHDYFFVFDFDAAVNIPLLPVAEAMARDGIDCVTSFAFNPVRPDWSHAAACADLSYANPAWVALINLFVSAGAARLLLSERQRLGRAFTGRPNAPWALSEAFVASALSSHGFRTRPLGDFADGSEFGTEFVYLESDPRAQRAGTVTHSVLDAPRFWTKFKLRTFNILMGEAAYGRLGALRDELLRVGCAEHDGWRIAPGTGNLALDRPATQSSVSSSSRTPLRAGLDARAIDARGGNCGVLHGHHGFHTDIEDGPWWMVDLQSVQAVGEVRLFNRLESAERARHLSIFVSTDGEAWARVFRKADERVFAGIDDPLICRLPQPVPARHLRVALDRRDWFHLNEIEVYAPGVPA